ncbi:MAG TPA: hypothetical protein VM582_09445, partial [Candidatus Thermoplasmatota archaeon]|nr:hypothetical protein [Candidatus Thermoplasmatota archaeon]
MRRARLARRGRARARSRSRSREAAPGANAQTRPPACHRGRQQVLTTLRPLLALALAALAIPLAAGTPDDATLLAPTCGARVLRAAEALAPIESARNHPAGPEACVDTIRPGAQMTSPAGCTFSFILRDGQGQLYTGSAAHCVGFVGQRVSARGIGPMGTVVTHWALGVDYSLIRIDADKHHLVSPTLCAWGGPILADPGDRPANDVLLEYGWGIATQAASQTRTRALIEIGRSPNFVEWAGPGSGGDSGGPIVSVEGYAVGSHTYGITPVAGVVREGG